MARLKRASLTLPIVAVLASPSVCLAEPPGRTPCTATGAEIAGLMVETKLAAVPDFTGRESEFRSDGDPETLEIIFLPEKKGAVSYVSDDGEVIFQYGDVQDKEGESLFTLAFCRRAVVRRSPMVEWQYKGSADFEVKTPGAGVVKRYEGDIGRIDVFLFSAGRDNWAEGTSDPDFKEMFDLTARAIMEGQEQGHYLEAVLEAPTDLVIAGHLFRHCKARFVHEGRLVESHTFMTALNGRLLKYRMSFQYPVPEALAHMVTNFVAQTVGDYENP